jgi:hypothetical protein
LCELGLATFALSAHGLKELGLVHALIRASFSQRSIGQRSGDLAWPCRVLVLTRSGVPELNQLNQVACRIMEHHPARAPFVLNAPRQLNAMSREALHCNIQVSYGQRKKRKARWHCILGRNRTSFEDRQKRVPHLEMRLFPMMGQ